MKTSLNPDIGIVNVLKNTFLSTRRNLVIILSRPSKPPYIPRQNLVLRVPYIYRRDKDRLLAIYSQREFESDFETALGVEGELTYLNVIVISNRNGKLFLHQT